MGGRSDRPTPWWLWVASGLLGALVAWPWLLTPSFRSCERVVQRWYGVPLMQAPFYLRVDYQLHVFCGAMLGLLTVAWCRRFDRQPWLWLAALVVLVFTDEFLQALSSSRTAGWDDLCSSLLGLTLGAVLGRVLIGPDR